MRLRTIGCYVKDENTPCHSCEGSTAKRGTNNLPVDSLVISLCSRIVRLCSFRGRHRGSELPFPLPLGRKSHDRGVWSSLFRGDWNPHNALTAPQRLSLSVMLPRLLGGSDTCHPIYPLLPSPSEPRKGSGGQEKGHNHLFRFHLGVMRRFWHPLQVLGTMNYLC